MRRYPKSRPRVPATATLPIVAAALAAPAAPAQETAWPTDGWAVSTPEDQGLAAEPLAELHRGIEAGEYGYIDRLVVVRNGHLVVSERYARDYREASRGRDMTAHQYNYYHPDWHPFYQGRGVHTLQSVTKSVTSALIGIAIARGEIEGIHLPVLSFFEEYDLSSADDRKRRMTIEDLLTMRAGIEWHETDVSYEDSRNTTVALEASQDWIQFTLDQPMDSEPGEKFVYNSGASHLLSGIIRKATGRFIDEYAEAHLFGPLGIREYHWKKTPNGYPDTEGGLYLEAEQLAKIGYLYLRDGLWGDRRILPEGWVEASTARITDDTSPSPTWNPGYGYKWWRLDRGGADVWAGLGYGGQFLLVVPEHDLVGVVNSWNLFGASQGSILIPFIDALLASAREAG